MKFELPTPPSVNNLFINARGPRGGRIKAPKYREWMTTAGWEIAAQRRGQERISEPVAIRIELSEMSRLDLDNAIKPTIDALVEHGVISDDNWKVVRRVEAERASVKGVRVTIVPASA